MSRWDWLSQRLIRDLYSPGSIPPARHAGQGGQIDPPRIPHHPASL